MNKVYAFLFMAVVSGIAVISNLLAVSALFAGSEFFLTTVFVLGVLLVVSVFLFGSWAGMLFSFALFSITLLTASVLFPLLFVTEKMLLALLFFSGALGFIGTILLWPQPRKKMAKSIAWDVPPMPLIDEAPPRKQNLRVSMYDLKNPEETQPVFDSLEETSVSDNDFVELDELDKLVQTQMAPAKKTKKGNDRKRRK